MVAHAPKELVQKVEMPRSIARQHLIERMAEVGSPMPRRTQLRIRAGVIPIPPLHFLPLGHHHITPLSRRIPAAHDGVELLGRNNHHNEERR